MWSSPGHYLLSPNSSNDPCSIINIAQYIEDYIDLVENIPNEIARHVSRLHEFNNRYYQLLNELNKFWESLANGQCYLTNGYRNPSSTCPSSSSTNSATISTNSSSYNNHHSINDTTLNYSKGSFSTSQIINKNVCKTTESSSLIIKTNSSSAFSSQPSSSTNSSSHNSTLAACKTDPIGTEKMFDQKKGLRAVYNLHKCLIEIQEISDEKLYIVQSILDLLDGKARQLDHDHRNVTIGTLSNSVASHASKIGSSLCSTLVNNESVNNSDSSGNSNNFEAIGKSGSNNFEGNSGEIKASSTKDSSAHNNGSNVGSGINNCNSNASLSNKRSSARRNMATAKSSDLANGDLSNNYKRGVKRGGVKGSGKDVKRNKSSKEVLNTSPPTLYEDTPIDPDEPTYCSCEQVSYGEMICCDNANCPIEWFHFACVSLATKPKGKWYCPNCRGDRSNIPKK